MTTFRAFLPKSRALFLKFLKKGRRDLPPPPSSYAPEIKIQFFSNIDHKTITDSKRFWKLSEQNFPTNVKWQKNNLS